MGFYGNITNTSNTTFQFDKIYPNRLAMDIGINTDGIFVGRFVLVEYQNNATYPIVYINNGKFYSSPNCEDVTRIKFLSGTRADNVDINNDGYFDGIYKGEYVQNYVNLKNSGNNITFDRIDYYKCTGEEGGYAKFVLTAPENKSNYIINYNIDEAHYGNEKGFKGYDSTVWTKTTVESNGKLITKYVQIADLNSVVPTFDIAADAPTMEPLTPHFDADSTNVYYKMHMQTPFGFRVKETSADKSDEQAIHYVTKYNKNTNTTTTTTKTVDADIFYNKNALTFKKNDTSNRITTIEPDEIKIVPTGKSENFATKYSHYSKGENIGDIQEMSIHLPSVGYMVSQGWDIIHGPNRNDDMREIDENGNRVDSLQGRLDSIAAIEKNQIPVKRMDNGQLVGTTINGDKNHETIDGLNNILKIDDFTTDDAWIKTQIKADNIPNSIAIHHTFNPTNDSSIEELNMNDYDGIEGGSIADEDTGFQKIVDQDTIQLYVPKVDAAGHVIGTDIDTITLPYGYKHFTTNGLVTTTNIDLDSSAGRKTTASNTQDTLAVNTKNKWLQIEVTNDKIELAHEIHNITKTDKSTTDLNNGTNTITIQDTVYDNAGHVTANQKHTYTLPYGFKYIDVANDGEEEIATPASTAGTQAADNTQDTLKLTTSNKWILLDGSIEDTVQFGHLLKTVPATTSTQNLSDETSQAVTFQVYDDSFDEAGHHSGRDTKTITMPFGYGKIKGDTGSTEATATFDELTISTNDSWIATTVSDDQVNIAHTGPVVTSVTSKSNIVDPNFGSTFTIEDWYFDAKGHKHTGKTHTVQFPKGSLNDLTATGSSVLTGISMVDDTGDITQQNANVGTLTLAEYTQGQSGGLKISDTNTINGAFKGIQDYINTLDMSDTSNTQFITKITQTDGQVAVERAAAGTLQLGTASTDGTIPENSSLNNAFNITNNRIKAEEEALAKEVQDRKDAITKEVNDRNTAISSAISAIVDKDDDSTINKLAEVIEWINNNPSTATQMQKAIQDNTKAISDEATLARGEESKIAAALTTETGRATAIEQNLQEQINAKLNSSIYEAKIEELELTIESLYGLIEELEKRIVALEPQLEEPEAPSIEDGE